MQASVVSDAEKEGKSQTMSSTTRAEVKQKSSSKTSQHESKKTSSQKSSSKKESEGHKKKDSVSSSKQLFEPCVFGKSKVWLPQEIIHNPGIFQEVVSMSTWENTLSDEDRKKLLKLLPSFPENNDDEQKETLKQLFDGVNVRFGNPLRQFEQDLIQGSYAVDSVEKQRAWERLQKEECHKQNSHRLQTMLPEVLIKRQELLEVVQFTSPSEYIKKPPQPVKKSKVDIQSNLKYEKLLEELSQEMGESFQSDEDSDKTVFTDEEECGSPKPWEDRLHNLFDSPPRKTHCTITPKPSSNELQNGTEESKTKIPEKSNVVTEKDYMRMLERMQIVKEDSIEHPEFIFSHITLRDIINRTYPMKLKSPEEISSLKRKRKKEKEEVKVKKKKRTPTSSPKPSTPVSVVSSQESAVGLEVPSSPESGTTIQPEVPTAPIIKQETPQPAAPASSEVQSKVQYQVPHSFFALLRKYFNMAMNHQLWVSDLQEKVSIWEKSPVSALCPWRPLQSTWSKVVENTLYFLSMEEQGRLVNYLEEEDAWMWPDPMSVPNDHLTKLFKRWLDLMLRVQPVASPVPSREGAVVIPEPRMYTDYTVKTSLEVDVKKFREQELQRFAEPHKPFTYFQHGYESVVGPVKGITSKDPLPASKGREHSLLVSDRPSYVTILSLVRDAVARLPNGEGTKIEICQLLRESQYIAPNSDASLLAAVSGALDRLHNEKDPSVKFDATRKLWVYLHRNRSMRDFERIQMERLIANRNKRSASKQRQAVNQGRPQTPFSSGDFPTDLAQSSSESSSPSLESPNRSSPASARSMSPRIPSLSPRSAGLGMDVKGLDLSKNPVALGTTYTVERPPTGAGHGVMKGTPPLDKPQARVAGQGGVFDPSLSTIQSLISESLIKSQLLKKTLPRSKTPPASLGRSNTAVTSGTHLLPTGGIQRSLSIPASWPHISCSAAGDLIPSDVLLTGNPVKLQAVKTQPKDPARQNASASKKGMDASSKARANSPRAGGSDKKSTQGIKSKSKGEKSKNSKSANAEKKSPTVQLKSGAITVTLPSSALKGQTVRSILASAASITIGKTSQGEEQSHPTVQAVRKRLLAEKNQAGIKAKQAKQAEVKVPVSEKSDSSGPSVPAKIDPKPTSLPTIILRPTAPTFIGQAQPKSKDITAVSAAQISSQPVALVAPKPAGIITGVAPSPSATANKQVPLSLVVSGSSSKGTHATTKPVPYLQQGNFPLPSLAPGQNIILQMPDGSKFVTSIPAAASAASSVQTKKQVPVKMVKAGGSSEDRKEKVTTSMSVIQPTMGRVLTTQQRKRSLPSPQQQTRPVVSTAVTSSNPYDFDDDLEVTKPVVQPFKQSSQPNVVMKSSAGPPNPVLTVTSTASALQGIALNLVTKPSGQTRRQGVVVATTGMVAHRPTIVTTQSPTIKEAPSSGHGTVSPKVLVSNQDVPQAMDFTIKSQKLMSSKGNSGENPHIPSSRVELPASSIIRSKPEAARDQDMKSSKTVLRGSQDVVTSKSVIVSGEEKMKVTSAPHGDHHSQSSVKQVTSKVLERPSQQMGARVTATLPPQASFTARGNMTLQRNPSNMAGMRVSYRPHSSPGILRKSSQDSSKKHNPGKVSLRTSRSVETSSITEQTLKAEVKGDVTGSGSRPGQKKPVKGLSKQVIILQKPESFSQSMPSSVSDTSTSKAGVKSLKGASEESSSVAGNSSVFTSDLVRSDTSRELEGSVRTAKLIKSQEKAEAESGGISKQDGQDQT